MVDASFTARVSNLFGILDQHNPQSSLNPSWCVSGASVQQSGRNVDDESDDEDCIAEHRECAEVISFLLFYPLLAHVRCRSELTGHRGSHRGRFLLVQRQGPANTKAPRATHENISMLHLLP